VDNRPALMTLCAVTFDCADPLALAWFYAQATGLADVDGSDGNFAGLRGTYLSMSSSAFDCPRRTV
jgi:hypothetical protein